MFAIKSMFAPSLVVFLTYLFLVNAAPKKKTVLEKCKDTMKVNYIGDESQGHVVCSARGEGEIGALDFTRTAPGVMSLSNLNSVHPGQGIGNDLVEYFIREVVNAKEYNKVILTVANVGRSNIAAVKMYEKNGIKWDADDKDTTALIV